MPMEWFRSWDGAPTDMKWLAIAKRTGAPAGIVSALMWALLDHASQQKDRGSIQGFDTEGYATFSGFDEQQIITIISALGDKGIIENNRFKSWEKRQPEYEDSKSVERQRRYRARLKGAVTSRHTESRNVTQRYDQSRNVTADETRKDYKDPLTPQDKPFNIDRLLTDDDREAARSAAPGYDQQYLMRLYDAGINEGERHPPNHPSRAYVGWCQAYSKGKTP